MVPGGTTCYEVRPGSRSARSGPYKNLIFPRGSGVSKNSTAWRNYPHRVSDLLVTLVPSFSPSNAVLSLGIPQHPGFTCWALLRIPENNKKLSLWSKTQGDATSEGVPLILSAKTLVHIQNVQDSNNHQ